MYPQLAKAPKKHGEQFGNHIDKLLILNQLNIQPTVSGFHLILLNFACQV